MYVDVDYSETVDRYVGYFETAGRYVDYPESETVDRYVGSASSE